MDQLQSEIKDLQSQLSLRQKDLEAVEIEKKRASDFQRKHQKLEQLYEADRAKFATEREKTKAEHHDLRKKRDKDLADFEQREQQLSRRITALTNQKQEVISFYILFSCPCGVLDRASVL